MTPTSLADTRVLLLVGGPEYHNTAEHRRILSDLISSECTLAMREDLDVLSDEGLDPYHVIVNYTTFLEPTARQSNALVNAIFHGKGYVGIHGATATFWNSPEYLRMLGGVFIVHDPLKLFKVQFGSGGPREYYFRLCRLVQQVHPTFEPDGLAEWAESQSEERVAEADRRIKELNIIVQKFIFDIFKDIYGLEGDAYWHKGVTDKDIRAKAYKKSLDDDENPLPLENYLDFIEYKKIVENRAHWRLFKPVFDIPEPGQKKQAKDLKWMERINELRRISAHATESRAYRLEDFEYIDYVYSELTRRVAAYERPQFDDVVEL